MRSVLVMMPLLFCLLQCHTPKKSAMFIPPSFDAQGHRGCRGLMPENTLPAMLHAIDLGVTTLEMDVVITADRQVVLSHEPFMSWEISTRPDGSQFTAKEEKQYNIYQMTYAELSRWDVGMKAHPRFRQQQHMPATKPLLKDLIDSVEAYIRKKSLKPVQYNIETKSDPAGDGVYHPLPAEFTKLVMDVVLQKGIQERVIIQSFDPRTLQVLHKQYPRIRSALLVEGYSKLSLDQHLAELGFQPTIYSPEYSLVNEALVKACKARGMKLIPWTVNTPDAILQLRQMGVDGIISDYPNLFAK
jgi:glycerophosphoryl diester phosphodiesterase